MNGNTFTLDANASRWHAPSMAETEAVAPNGGLIGDPVLHDDVRFAKFGWTSTGTSTENELRAVREVLSKSGKALTAQRIPPTRKALRDATIHAPFNGIIVKRLVNEGEYASVMPATPLVIIEEVDPLDLRIQIPSSEMANVKAGDMVRARCSAIAEIPNKDHALRSGLYAEVTLTGVKAPDAGVPKGRPVAKPTPAKPTPAKPAAPVAKD